MTHQESHSPSAIRVIRSISELDNWLRSNPEVERRLLDELCPAGGGGNGNSQPLGQSIYRWAVVALALAVILALLFTFVLILLGRWNTGSDGGGNSDIFLSIGSASVGALAGLLAPFPLKH